MSKMPGMLHAYLLVTMAVAVHTGHSVSHHTGPALSDALTHSLCSVDLQKASLQCVNSSLVKIPTNLPSNTSMLDLTNNHITEVAAEDIGHLPSVMTISLQNNMLTAISADAFVNCTSLHSLYLDHNMLSSLRFVSSTQLQELHISFNNITVLDTGRAVLLLRTVDLSFNIIQHEINCSSLSPLQNVRILNLSHNLIEKVIFDDPVVLSLSHLSSLDVSANRLKALTLCSKCYSYSLQCLNVSDNQLHSIESNWCEALANLTVLVTSHNPISHVSSGMFRHCSSLHTLHLSKLLIRQIDAGMFTGLSNLRTLRLEGNSHLVSLHRHSFRYLTSLIELDLSDCSLVAVEPGTFVSQLSLQVIKLGDNPWDCGCEATLLHELMVLSTNGVHISEDAVCVEPATVKDQYLLNVSSERDECRAARPRVSQQSVWAHIGSDLTVDCNATGDEPINVTWFWKNSGKSIPFIQEHDSLSQDIAVLQTGSLYIRSVSRSSAGLYYCIVSNEFGSGTMVLSVRLNSDAISITTLYSIIIGLLSATGFFLIAVVIGIVRYLAYLCSTKERRKRKSIRAVLESIQDYKCAQFDRFSAYRTAKMDQLSAFKSAKIEQLSAFRDARVDRLRTYKQATVASILTHIERMREHYTAQTARIKDNCAQQAECLRRRYTARRGRFKNYRSHQVDKMRENYAAQAARIREYGVVQMSRLREQYKTQQQYVLKLVELLDVGSCVSGVIEAECMKAESMIFDADIAFDFEAQPVHANESLIGAIGDTASESVMASDSDLSVSSEEYNVTCIDADVNGSMKTDADDVAGVLAVADDLLRHIRLDEMSQEDDNIDQMSQDERQQQMTNIGHRSSSDGAAERSTECEVELAGVADEPMYDHNVEQDTSC